MTTSQLTRFSMLLALGVILNYMELMLIPTAFIAPGVKLGLANAVGLIVLYLFKEKEYLIFGFLRVLLTALFTGFGFGFLIGFSGYVVSSMIVLAVVQLKTLSIFGLSLVGAVSHGVGQIIMVTYLYQTPYMVNYLPLLIFTGMIAGLLVAYISREVLIRLKETV
jgi:heptaprenyl diphosphate synthase